jgi:hypothetical protein
MSASAVSPLEVVTVKLPYRRMRRRPFLTLVLWRSVKEVTGGAARPGEAGGTMEFVLFDLITWQSSQFCQQRSAI